VNRITKAHSLAMVSLNHYRAAQIVLEQHGQQAEEEIFSHVARMQDQGDTVGVRSGCVYWRR
jgi:hypothetical protein